MDGTYREQLERLGLPVDYDPWAELRKQAEDEKPKVEKNNLKQARKAALRLKYRKPIKNK